jgi:hypothetical protein
MRPPIDPSELEERVRQEGGIEHLEQLVAQWAEVRKALQGSDWSRHGEHLELSERLRAEETASSVDLARSVLGRRHLSAVKAEREAADGWATRRLGELGLPVLEPRRALEQLREELPLRLERQPISLVGSEGFSWTHAPGWSGLLKLGVFIVALASAIRWLVKTPVGLGAFALVFLAPLALRLFGEKGGGLTICRRTLSCGKHVVALDQLSSVLGVSWVRGDQKEGVTDLRFYCKHQPPFTARLRGDASSVVAALAEANIPYEARTQQRPTRDD